MTWSNCGMFVLDTSVPSTCPMNWLAIVVMSIVANFLSMDRFLHRRKDCAFDSPQHKKF